MAILMPKWLIIDEQHMDTVVYIASFTISIHFIDQR